MTPVCGVRPVPWAFFDHDLMKMWVWRTDHFEVRVSADFNSFNWVITDFMASAEGRFLTEGRTRTFQEAEEEVREAVGKSYPPRLGYTEYAGPLASTFTIATGDRVDFGQFVGQRTIVTVRMPDRTEKSFVGVVRAVHYEVHVTPDSGQPVRIQPSHIVRVAGEGGRRAVTAATTSHTGLGRVHHGSVTLGCTGRPGFMPNTIDHTGSPCPVHEDSVGY